MEPPRAVAGPVGHNGDAFPVVRGSRAPLMLAGPAGLAGAVQNYLISQAPGYGTGVALLTVAAAGRTKGPEKRGTR
jgi:hypothetical protein